MEQVSQTAIRFNNSPFAYHKAMYAKRQAAADCSKKNLVKLITKRELLKIDRQILFALGKYGYLNAYLLRRYVAIQGLNANPSFMKDRLLFLQKNGLIQRYEFFHKDPGMDAECGSPFVYGISGGGWMLLKMSGKMQLAAMGIRECQMLSDLDDQDSIARVLCMLAENQFAILFFDQYRARQDMTATINGACFDACGQRLSFCIVFPDGRAIELFPFAVRRSVGWEERYREHLQSLHRYCKDGQIRSFSVLVLCETSEHALTCEHIRQKIPDCRGLDVFYGLDHTISACPDVLGRMLDIQCHEGGVERRFFRLDLG